MQAGGIDPGRDVNLVVLPPPFMVESLESGHLDGFCVGAPWNSLAVQADLGRILHFGTDIRRNCPEKVLGVRAEWDRANSDVTNGLVRAIAAASRWCGDFANLDELAGLMARDGVLGISRDVVGRIVAGNLTIAPGVVRSERDYLVLGREAISGLIPRMLAGSLSRWSPPGRRCIRRQSFDRDGRLSAGPVRHGDRHRCGRVVLLLHRTKLRHEPAKSGA